MSTVTKTHEIPHTPSARSFTAPSLPCPTDDTPEQAYPGDLRCLLVWFGCAGLLVLLHVGQHVVYLLR